MDNRSPAARIPAPTRSETATAPIRARLRCAEYAPHSWVGPETDDQHWHIRHEMRRRAQRLQFVGRGAPGEIDTARRDRSPAFRTKKSCANSACETSSSGNLAAAPTFAVRIERPRCASYSLSLRTGHGDVTRLTDREGLYRLRVGKWRLFFDLDTTDTVRIHGIDNRGEALIAFREALSENASQFCLISPATRS